MKTYKGTEYNGHFIPAIPRHEALVNTSVTDARARLYHYTIEDMADLKKAIKLELAKGGDARTSMVQLLNSTIQRLEKQAWEKQQEVPDESA